MQITFNEGRKGKGQMSSIKGQTPWTRVKPDREHAVEGQVPRWPRKGETNGPLRGWGEVVQGVG